MSTFEPALSEISKRTSHRSTLINFASPLADRKFARIMLLEYLGATIFGIGLQAAEDDLDIQLCIFSSILFSAKHSGAHYHMAVTLILMFRPHHSIEKRRGVLQILAGIAGFMTGGLIGYLLYGKLMSPRLQTYEREWVIADLCGEILATTSFQFVNVLLFERATQPFRTPLYNTILLVVGIFFSRKLSPHSGGCMNPTIAVGLNLAVAIIERRIDLLKHDMWLFILGPMTGSLLVFCFYYGFVQPRAKLCKRLRSFGDR